MLDEGQQAILGAPGKLEAVVQRPEASAFGEDAYPTLAEKAAALPESLAIGQPLSWTGTSVSPSQLRTPCYGSTG